MTAYGLTDIGRKRKNNQDNFKIYNGSDYMSIVVCDGMGGAKSGNVASKIAAETYTKTIRQLLSKVRKQEQLEDNEIEQIMLAAVSAANTAVFDKATTNYSEYEGMGTTLVAMLHIKGKTTVVNVGDSRAYALKKTVLVQVTKDHSFVQFLIDSGSIKPTEAEKHPNKNLILRSIGVNESIEADIYMIKDFAAILLCSDGLTNMLSDEEIRAIVKRRKKIDEKTIALIEAANLNGGDDNITAVLFEKS